MEDAAFELYEQRGFSATTVRDIAEAAGTTERTFFRHFRDKVDVAFGDEQRLMELAADATATASPTASAWEAVLSGLQALAVQFDQHRDVIVRRALVVNANPPLFERELSRATDWADMIVSALRQRNVATPTAQTCATTGLALFRVALERWIAAGSGTLSAELDVVGDELRSAL
jgi:AcrR family transcriptional regulator